MEILCSLKNLHLTFGSKELFTGADLTIHRGEKIGLLGLNGKGKSSLFKILDGELKADNSTPPCLFDKAKGNGKNFLGYSCFYIPQELPLEDNDQVTINEYFFRFYPKIESIHHELEKINDEFSTQTDPDKIDKLINRQEVLHQEFETLNGLE